MPLSETARAVLAMLGVACLAALPLVWRTPDASELALFVIAPLAYTALVRVVMLDAVLWQVVPAGHALAGAALVISASPFVRYRERLASHRRDGPGR